MRSTNLEKNCHWKNRMYAVEFGFSGKLKMILCLALLLFAHLVI